MIGCTAKGEILSQNICPELVPENGISLFGGNSLLLYDTYV